ncbi:probable isoaspartyl peptidase/L-asparaginase GA20639 [Culicoides brevitarsis]|uniref:probable isoaspartyl peptidase/L-asparaginase GA20639 n=1 Tax=Culicoides brevitarsis TaxID=469753 RepID=UPI00307CA865
MEPVVIVHGGAGDIPTSRVEGKLNGVKKAVKTGYKSLLESGSVLQAVEDAVKVMELDENFNAGYGSVLTCDGTVEMEASLMEMRKNALGPPQINAGCVTLVKDIHHPISLARKVLETPHNFIGGEQANILAKKHGFEILPDGALITEFAKLALEEWKNESERGTVQFARTEIGEEDRFGEGGTVGAVAIDKDGNIAVATSTGGITGKYRGRIGDTPLLGCGTFCNEFGGVSTTGHGETIMKSVLAHDILKRIEYLGQAPQKACEEACRNMTKNLEGTGGAICIDKNGEVGVYFTSNRMAWAYQKKDTITYGINHKSDKAHGIDILSEKVEGKGILGLF